MQKNHWQNGCRLEFEDHDTRNLAAEVSIPEPIVYARGTERVVIVDCGVKNNIIRAFLRRNITVIRCPWNYEMSDLNCITRMTSS
jgi:carbamoyl-phosphate synthase small subunit